MSFAEAVKSVFSQYANFSGRARRSEFWYFVLLTFLVSLVLSFFSTLLADVWALVILVPTLAVTWRRLHDVGRSGAWYFIFLVPLVGWIFLLVWICTDSQPGDNRYGPNPKGL